MPILTTNQEGSMNHLSLFHSLMAEANEVYIAVAFLKTSAIRTLDQELSPLMDDPTKVFHFYVGISMGVTDPSALRALHKVTRANEDSLLCLCDPSAGIFHPKIYLFINGKKATVVIGSANMSERAWSVNDEVSVQYDIDIRSDEYLAIKAYFDRLQDTYFEPDVEALITEYESQLEEYKRSHAATPEFKFLKRRRPSMRINYDFFRRYLTAYPQSVEYVNPARRVAKYTTAREILNEIADFQFATQADFFELYGQLVGQEGYEKLWHSGSMHRQSYKTGNSIPQLQRLIRFVRDNANASAEEVFRGSIAFHQDVMGVGPNIVTEIMMTYNWYNFANLNKNPVTVLRASGRQVPDVSQFTGSSYQEYTQDLLLIQHDLELDNMLNIDSFFNYIYWDLMQTEHL